MIPIIHQDDALLIVAKPSGLPTTAPNRRDDCLVARVAQLDPTAPRLHATSRLDADVTGLVTFARTKAAADVLLAARRAGVYHRRYDALTLSAPAEDEGAWEWAIATHARDKRMRVALIATDTPRGAGAVRDSRTRFRVDARGPLGARLALFPETGRTHQLRVHALAAGAGLFGDRVYRCPTRATCPDGRVITARRVMLHCALLRLPDVAADDPEAPPLEITAAWPTDFRRAADGLGVGAPGPSVSA